MLSVPQDLFRCRFLETLLIATALPQPLTQRFVSLCVAGKESSRAGDSKVRQQEAWANA